MLKNVYNATLPPQFLYFLVMIKMDQALLRVIILLLAGALLAGCSVTTSSNPLADAYLPPDAPPRPGTLAYEDWQAERALEAARPKGKAAERR